MNQRRVYTLILCVLVAVLAQTPMAPPAHASALTGEITRAEANDSWTLASIAGSAAWGECIRPPGWSSSTVCSWRPYVTVGPGSELADCASPERRWGQLGESVTLAWYGKSVTSDGSAEFDVTDVPISGEADQLACLSLVEDVWEPYPCPIGTICIQIVGNSTVRFPVLDAALLDVRSEAPPEEEEGAPEEPEPGPEEPSTGSEEFKLKPEDIAAGFAPAGDGDPTVAAIDTGMPVSDSTAPKRCGEGTSRRHNTCTRTRTRADRTCRKRKGASKRRCLRHQVR